MRLAGHSPLGALLVACASHSSTPFALPDGAPEAAAQDGESSIDVAPADVSDELPAEAAWSGSVPCGNTVCSSATQYCLEHVPEGGLTPDAGASSACEPIPAGCAASPSCSCIAPLAPCGAAFAGCVQAGGIDVTCASP